MPISHEVLPLQCLLSGEGGLDTIVQGYSELRKNYNLISKPYTICRGVAERVCYQKENNLTHGQSQTHLEVRRWARHVFTVPFGLLSSPMLVSLGGNLENPFCFSLFIVRETEAREIPVLGG